MIPVRSSRALVIPPGLVNMNSNRNATTMTGTAQGVSRTPRMNRHGPVSRSSASARTRPSSMATATDTPVKMTVFRSDSQNSGSW